MTMVLVIGCLMTMWLVFGRGWWLTRAGVALLAVLLLFPIGAYQPIVWFVVWALATIPLLIPLRLWAERTAIHDVRTPPESSRPLRWFRVVAVVVSLVIAFYCLNRCVARVPALGWREMSLVVGGAFFTSLLLFTSFYERRQIQVKPFDSNSPCSNSLKFSLNDTLLLTGVLAVAAAIVSYALRTEPIVNTDGFLLFGLLIALITTLVAVIVMVRHLPIQIIVAVFLIALTAMSQSQLDDAYRWCMEASAYGSLRPIEAEKARAITARGFVISLLMSVWIMATTGWFFRTNSATSPPRASIKIARVAMLLLSGLVLACLVPIYVKIIRPLPPRTFVSNPIEQANYRQLVDEIGKIQTSPWTLSGSEELSTLATLDLLLSEPFAVWGVDNHNPNLGNQLEEFRVVARRFRQDAVQATSDRPYRENIDAAMRCLRLGSGLSRGGCISHLLTGIAIEDIGYERLASVHDQIPIDEVAALLAEFAAIKQTRESLASIKAAADLDCERWLGWRYRLSMVGFELTAARPEHCHTMVSPTVQASEAAIKRRDTAQRLVETELTIRLFTAAHDRPPATLNELVPDFLTSVGLDPYSEAPLIYRTDENGYTLYSIGQDGIDDGGNFGTNAGTFRNGYDWNIDTWSKQ